MPTRPSIADLDEEERVRRSVSSFRMPEGVQLEEDDSFSSFSEHLFQSIAQGTTLSSSSSSSSSSTPPGIPQNKTITSVEDYDYPENLPKSVNKRHHLIQFLENDRKRYNAQQRRRKNAPTIQAQALTKKDKTPLATVEELEHKDQKRQAEKQSNSLKVIGMMVFAGTTLLVALTLGLVVVVRSMRAVPIAVVPTMAPSTAPSITPTVSPFVSIVDGLPEETLETIQYFPTSPQARAYEWIKEDPLLSNYTTPRIRQRFALMTLYYSTDGNSWTTSIPWIDDEGDECEERRFYRQYICDQDDNLIELNLSANGLWGPMPPEMGLLSSLRILDLSNNFLRGSLPTTIAQLSLLQHFHLDDNLLTGSISTELGLLSSLRTINLGTNGFVGSLPTEIGLLQNLTDLDIHQTSIEGFLPTEIGRCTSLENLSTWNAPLNGTLPTEIGQLSLLKRLAMHNGAIEGNIPTEFGLLTELEHLQLDLQRLSGSIPSEMANLQKLSTLSIALNQLNSTIPTELALLSTNLQLLRLHHNRLSGLIPTDLGLLTGLQSLELDSNQLDGSFPSQLGQLQNVTKLFFGRNLLTGMLPSEIAAMTRLEQLAIQYNEQLKGSIPMEWSGLANQNLSSLILDGIPISGTIPDPLCGLQRLRVDCSAMLCGCQCGAC